MTDEHQQPQPFQPPLPPGMTAPLPPGQAIPAGTRGAEKPLRDLTQPAAVSRPVGVGTVATGSKLLPEERAALEQLGWKEGDPIPTDLAQLLPQATQNPGDVRLPGQPSGPTPLSQAAVAQGSNVLSHAKEALGRTQAMSGGDESVQKAMAAAVGAGNPDVEIVDDTKKEEEQQETADTGFDPSLMECPRCHFDLRLRDPIEVTDGDKQRFLQAILGQQPFQKEFSLMNGALRVTLRSSTPEELDKCFEAAYIERQKGKYQAPDAYFELINRFRLALQLHRIESGEINHLFPSNLDGWKEVLRQSDVAERLEEEPVIKLASEYLFNHIIRTEMMNRMLGQLSGEFISLLAKLEANSYNPDFWSTTKSDT